MIILAQRRRAVASRSVATTPAKRAACRTWAKRVAAGHEWPEPATRKRATDNLLALVATVEYRGDDNAYAQETWSLTCALMNPVILKNRAHMQLLRLRTSKAIHSQENPCQTTSSGS